MCTSFFFREYVIAFSMPNEKEERETKSITSFFVILHSFILFRLSDSSMISMLRSDGWIREKQNHPEKEQQQNKKRVLIAF